MIKPRTDKINELKEMSNNNLRLIVLNQEFKYIYILIENNEIIRFLVEDIKNVSLGDIYCAKIASVNKSVGGCFSYIINKTEGFIADVNPEDIILLNRKYDGVLKQGDELFVKIIKESYGKKAAVCKPLNSDEIAEFYKDTKKYSSPSLIKKSSDVLEEIIEEYSGNKDFNVIITDEKIKEKLKPVCEKYTVDLKLHLNEDIPLRTVYGLKSKFERITEEKVWLKNGGYLFINKTEAMTVIDVNSGKIIAKDKEQGMYVTCMDAAKEIAYQIGVRNISGIIIVDMLKIKDSDNKTKLINYMNDVLGALNPPAKLVDITKLGLFEITRQKKYPDIYTQLSKINKTILL